MYIVRDTFTAKPGHASTLARLLKQVMAETTYKTRILTDYVASLNTVVMETELEDLAAFDRMMAEYATRQDLRDKLRGYTDMYVGGRREVYRVV